MTSFNYTQAMIELDNQIGTPSYVSKIIPNFRNVLVKFSLDSYVQIKEWSLDRSYSLTPQVETKENNTKKLYHLIASYSEFYGITKKGLIKAKEIQGVDTGYWSFAGNEIISEFYKQLDRDLYGNSLDGNIGITTGITPTSLAITTGEVLINTMISNARSLNLSLGRDATSPVVVYLSGALSDIYGTNVYNSYKTIAEILPNYIKVVELPSFINSSNRMDICSFENNLIYRGELPRIMTNGVEVITDATFERVQGMVIGYQTASMYKKDVSVKSIIKA